MIDHYVLIATMQAERQLKTKRGNLSSKQRAPRISPSSSEVLVSKGSFAKLVKLFLKDKNVSS
jgi:hypothetical protein